MKVTESGWTRRGRSAIGLPTQVVDLEGPWHKLYQRYPGINSNDGDFKFKKVTVAKLFAAGIPDLVRPSSWGDGAATVVSLLSPGSFQTYTLVAQLNFLLLSPVASNQIEKCVTALDLKEMASGSYSPRNLTTVTWGPVEIQKYLTENWIVIP